MLISQHALLQNGQRIFIQKTVDGKDVSHKGAFAHGTRIVFSVRIPRTLGVSAAVLRIAPDGGEDVDHPLSFVGCSDGVDTYAMTLDTSLLCGEYGLFYYEFLFLRGVDTLFTDTFNNVDFELAQSSAGRFRLLIHTKDFCTPKWFFGGVMYHVFVDRFFCGEGPVSLRKGAVIDPDWEGGIPQYPKKRGDAIANNVFFGGNLWGVAQKLDYLKTLGVTTVYLSPIFEAASNHRYDTGDYEAIDGLLGGDAAFDALVSSAHEKGIKIVLDGVFNHTGDDSRYFNRRQSYESLGAYQSGESKYVNWYNFRSYPEEYECWWGIEILPRLNHGNEDCRAYFTSEDGVVAKWTERGVDGWRLDVADELCDAFLEELRATVKKKTDGQGLIIGEVWENAADKIAYGKRRRYLCGNQLDSVMNYPFRNAILAFLLQRDATVFCDILKEIYASYPTDVCNSLMNLLSTHDTERILTLLGRDKDEELLELSNEMLATRRLSPEHREKGIGLLKLASALQYTVFGVPSVYYGDEAGLEGYHDPFCRMPYPWGREDEDLLSHYRALGEMRRGHTVFADGDFRFLEALDSAFLFARSNESETVLVAANMGEGAYSPTLPAGTWRDIFTGNEMVNPTVKQGSYLILVQKTT
ncbi:MAG: glycoside hydrolase family 13 protein [Clostridia bacterium]|nr:glycoside hydrolase family 13 protein [Clostridia bacterium]